MAERDRDDWERGRRSNWGPRDDRGWDDRGRSDDERGMMSRGADEVRSWFGDDEARRRRERDEAQDRSREAREYGPNSDRARREHGWHSGDSSRMWGGERESAYGDQRDFVGRYNEQRDFMGRGGEFSRAPYSPRGREWHDPGWEPGGTRWRGGSRDTGDEDTRRGSSWGYTDTSGAVGRGASSGFGSSGEHPASAWSGGFGSGFGGSYGRGMTAQEPRWGTGQSHAGRGPRSYQRSDDRVREDVNECLTADPRIDASEIDVRVQNGEVILSGSVDERRTRRLAEEIIENLPGVRDVRNELRVSQGNSWSQQGSQQGGQQASSQGRGHDMTHTSDQGHDSNIQRADVPTTKRT